MKCKRVHFFGQPLSEQERGQFPASIGKDFARSYLGFTVIRPLPQHALGRSVLSVRLLKHSVPEGISERSFLTCATWYRTHLAGNELRLSGCPWMQQDAHVSACATAALWVACYQLAHRFPYEFRRFSTAEITDLANRISAPFGRAMPSAGLAPEQIVHALGQMGFSPVLLQLANASEALREIYHYVESGLPVILLLRNPDDQEDGHAVTVVGHTLLKSTLSADQVSPDSHAGLQRSGIMMSVASDFVPAFVVQDDMRGPFLTASLFDAPGPESAQDDVRECFVLVQSSSGDATEYRLLGGIVPLPELVGLTGLDAELRAVLYMFKLYSSADTPHFVVRTSLQKSNDLKSLWTNHRRRPEDLGRHLKSHILPRWVWVTEIAKYDEWQTGRLIRGFVIQDSSGLAAIEGFHDVVAFQLDNILGLIDQQGGGRLIRVSNRPYPRLSRHQGRE